MSTLLDAELSPAARRVDAVLCDYLSVPTRRALFQSAGRRAGVDPKTMGESELTLLVRNMLTGLRMFSADAEAEQRLQHLVHAPKGGGGSVIEQAPSLPTADDASEDAEAEFEPNMTADSAGTKGTATTVQIQEESDILSARFAARAHCFELGLRGAELTKIVTAVSELARNIFQYAGRGDILVQRVHVPRLGIEVIALDSGPGILDVGLILSGRYRSRSGMGAGLRGCRAVADEFEIETAPGKGTRVRLVKYR